MRAKKVDPPPLAPANEGPKMPRGTRQASSFLWKSRTFLVRNEQTMLFQTSPVGGRIGAMSARAPPRETSQASGATPEGCKGYFSEEDKCRIW